METETTNPLVLKVSTTETNQPKPHPSDVIEREELGSNASLGRTTSSRNRWKLHQVCRMFFARHRNFFAVWIFGLTTNFAFVVSLSAAQDILTDDNSVTTELPTDNRSLNASTNSYTSERLICNKIGTGVVLLSAIVPELIIKFAFQFSTKQLSYRVKTMIIASCVTISFITLAFAKSVWLRIFGVCITGIAIGLGDQAFLAMTSFYHKDVITAWSSGTGASGLLGSVTYAGFTSLGISTRVFILIMLVIPVSLLSAYAILLKSDTKDTCTANLIHDAKMRQSLTFAQKIAIIPSLLKYLIPLCVIYLAVYFINQGLHELLYFNGQILSREEQYRWFHVIHWIGSFLSRSSAKFVKIRNLWILPVLLVALTAALTCQVFFRIIPYLAIIMILVFVEGVLNGLAYVNTFFCVTTELDPEKKEFALGFVTSAGPLGIVLAGAIAVPFHNYICTLDLSL